MVHQTVRREEHQIAGLQIGPRDACPPRACASASRAIVTPRIANTRCVSPEQSKPKPDVPPHKYGRPRNSLAVRTTSADAFGNAAPPAATTTTSLLRIATARPSGSVVSTESPLTLNAGSRVAMLTSTNRPPSVPYTHAVGVTTTASRAASSRSPKTQLGKGNPARIPARIKRRRLIRHDDMRPGALHLLDDDSLAEEELTVDASVQFAPLARGHRRQPRGRRPERSLGRVNSARGRRAVPQRRHCDVDVGDSSQRHDSGGRRWRRRHSLRRRRQCWCRCQRRRRTRSRTRTRRRTRARAGARVQGRARCGARGRTRTPAIRPPPAGDAMCGALIPVLLSNACGPCANSDPVPERTGKAPDARNGAARADLFG